MVAGLAGPASSQPAADLPETVARTMSGLPAEAGGSRASRKVKSPIPFSMVGFEIPPGAGLEFRTSVDGQTWTAWTEAHLEPDEGPDVGSAEGQAADRHVSAPVWVGEAAHLQTRSTGEHAVAEPADVTAHVIDSSGLGRSWRRKLLDRLGAAWRGTPRAADAMTTAPDIVSRAQWGADESLRRSSPSYGSEIVAGFVHHTVNANNYSQSEADDLVRGIYRYHVSSRGWSDIGYNFLVDRFGTVYEGRYGGVTRPVVGAHAAGFNTNTFGVSLIGNFETMRPPTVMLGGLRTLLAWKYDYHHVYVGGEVKYSEYGTNSSVTLNRLSGHRDVGQTACPGRYTYDLLPGLRSSVAELQGPVILYPDASPRSLDVHEGQSVEGPVRFTALLRPAGSWRIAVLDPDNNVVHVATGSGQRVDHEWLPTGVRPGTYRYRLTSPNRRAGVGSVRMVPPSVVAAATPTAALYRPNGTLYRPISLYGTLYTGARWSLRIVDPDGSVVSLTRGTGVSMSVKWAGPVTQPGPYEWRLAVDGLLRKRGPLRIYADRVGRLASSTSVAEAAAAISRRAFAAGSAQRAVIVTSREPGYAMAAGPLTGTQGPILYTMPTRVSDVALTELKRVLAPLATVYVMGSASVVSDQVVAQLAVELRRPVRRIEGSGPALAAASAADVVTSGTDGTSAVLMGVIGTGAWRQAVAGAGSATAKGQPVLLTARTRLTPAAREAIVRNGITDVTIVGNGTTVSTAVRRQLPSTVRTVRRVSGTSGAATAVQVARQQFGRVPSQSRSDDSFLFLSGERRDGWVRALAAAPLAARTRAPLLFSNRTSVPDATRTYLLDMAYDRHVLARGTVLGNTDHIGGTTRAALARLLQ